jgi:hypothetical protein
MDHTPIPVEEEGIGYSVLILDLLKRRGRSALSGEQRNRRIGKEDKCREEYRNGPEKIFFLHTYNVYGSKELSSLSPDGGGSIAPAKSLYISLYKRETF